MKKYYVYMLRCSDGSFYVGITNNLAFRLEEHASGFNKGCYTYKRLPVELVYQRCFKYVRDAIAWEKHIKRWSRKKKEALITNDTLALRTLSHSPSQPALQRWRKTDDQGYCHPEPDEG